VQPSEKLAALNRLAQLDARHPAIRTLAAAIREIAEQAPARDWAAVELAACVARDLIGYRSDTDRVGSEDIAGITRPDAHPLEALWRGVDDCDAKARLFVALARALGLPARVEGEIGPEGLAHVWGAVQIGDQWLPVETTLARARVGDRPREVPRETGGQWLTT